MNKRTVHDQWMKKMNKKLSRLVFVLAAAVMCSLTAGCARNNDQDGEAVTVVVEDVSEAAETLETGETAETDLTSAAPAAAEEDPHLSSVSSDDQAEKDAGAVDGRKDTVKGAFAGEEIPDAAGTGAASIKEEDPEAAGTRAAAMEEADPDAAGTRAAPTEEEEPGTAGTKTAEIADADSAGPGAQQVQEDQNGISFDGESDLEYNARQIMLADESITKEGALGVAAYLWQMGFGRMSGYPTVGEVNGGTVLTVFDEEGLFYNIILTPEGKIQQVEDVEGNELISLGTKAGERMKPPLSGADVIALLEEWKSHGGHGEVVAAYNQFAGDYGRSRMDGGDQWCSETVSAAYAALGAADRIGGMASNGFSYEKNARSIGAWVSGGGYIPNIGDIVITQDSAGARHTSCVVSCDGHTIHTIAGGGSSIHHGTISVGSDRIAGFVVPEW